MLARRECARAESGCPHRAPARPEPRDRRDSLRADRRRRDSLNLLQSSLGTVALGDRDGAIETRRWVKGEPPSVDRRARRPAASWSPRHEGHWSEARQWPPRGDSQSTPGPSRRAVSRRSPSARELRRSHRVRSWSSERLQLTIRVQPGGQTRRVQTHRRGERPCGPACRHGDARRARRPAASPHGTTRFAPRTPAMRRDSPR